VQVFSDHQNLEYFTTTKVLNRRQARWAQKLAGIDFKIFYRPEVKNGKPDALSRRPEYRPEKGGDEDQPITMVLHPKHFEHSTSAAQWFIISAAQMKSIPAIRWSEDFLTLVKEAAKDDMKYCKAIALAAQDGRTRIDGRTRMDGRARTDGILEIQEGCMYRKEKLWVPEGKGLRQGILELEHDTKVAGYMGQDKTIELIRRNFWWPKMDKDIIDFICSCPECQKNKAVHH